MVIVAYAMVTGDTCSTSCTHADIAAKCRGDAHVPGRKPRVTVEMVFAYLFRRTYLL
jgi:hypothetical protein